MVLIASSIESSAPMVTGFPWPKSPAFAVRGSPPSAKHLMTMSRSVTMPLSRLSSPQMGSAPTSRSFIFRASASSLSFSPMHSTPPVMISRTLGMTLSYIGCSGPRASASPAPFQMGQQAHQGHGLKVSMLSVRVQIELKLETRDELVGGHSDPEVQQNLDGCPVIE